jgi:pimeloyl-ACP methyl ester carboxylesterase
MIKQLYTHFVRLYFTVLSAWLPVEAGRKAFMLFQRTRKLPFKEMEKRFYETAKKFDVAHPRENIHAYELGNTKGKLVILIHGWDSNAGSMGAIAQVLATEGYRVVSLDLPAHGYSTLTHTNLRECREVLRALIYQLRPSEAFSVISHSFGSAVATLALASTRYEIDKFIMLTSPNKLIDVFDDFKKLISLGDEAYLEMQQQAENILKQPVCTVDVEIKALQVNYKRLSIIHDENDKVLPYSNSVRLNKVLPESELITLKNTGHYSMLWNMEVIRKVVTQLTTEEQPHNYLDEYVTELLSA